MTIDKNTKLSDLMHGHGSLHSKWGAPNQENRHEYTPFNRH